MVFDSTKYRSTDLEIMYEIFNTSNNEEVRNSNVVIISMNAIDWSEWAQPSFSFAMLPTSFLLLWEIFNRIQYQYVTFVAMGLSVLQFYHECCSYVGIWNVLHLYSLLCSQTEAKKHFTDKSFNLLHTNTTITCNKMQWRIIEMNWNVSIILIVSRLRSYDANAITKWKRDATMRWIFCNRITWLVLRRCYLCLLSFQCYNHSKQLIWSKAEHCLRCI